MANQPATAPDTNCIFCQIVTGDMPSHKVWEDESHLAFLSIFPNTEGVTVVIPKTHHGSYAFEQENNVLTKLVLATKKVVKILDNYFEDVGRTGMIFEGFGVDHLHSKLFPMHGTGSMEEWSQIESEHFHKYFDKYPGYLSSNDSDRVDDERLAKLASEIKKSSRSNQNN